MMKTVVAERFCLVLQIQPFPPSPANPSTSTSCRADDKQGVHWSGVGLGIRTGARPCSVRTNLIYGVCTQNSFSAVRKTKHLFLKTTLVYFCFGLTEGIP